ncbi:hypothetical protein OH690_10430 [Escherichia coli]|nr:hypothetical protein [Escherichia coli]
MAAGLDKDGERIDALGAMGFDRSRSVPSRHVHSQVIDKPRLFRLVDAEGLINRMGFNNLGVDNPRRERKKPIMMASWY